MKKITLPLAGLLSMVMLVAITSANGNKSFLKGPMSGDMRPPMSGNFKPFSGDMKHLSGNCKPFSGTSLLSGECKRPGMSGDMKNFSGERPEFSGDIKRINKITTSSETGYTAPNGKEYIISYVSGKGYTSSNFKTTKYFKTINSIKAYINKSNKK